MKSLRKKNDLNYTSINVEAKQSLSYAGQQGQIEIPVSSLKKILEN